MDLNEEKFTIYLKYSTLEDLLKIIAYSGQSNPGLTPLLYYTEQNLFTLSCVGNYLIVNYGDRTKISLSNKCLPESAYSKKFIELKQVSSLSHRPSDKKGNNFKEILYINFVDTRNSRPRYTPGTELLYIPIIKVEKSSIQFP